MALSFDDKKQVRKALLTSLGRNPTDDEYRQALLHHPNTRQYQDLDNLADDTKLVDDSIKKDDLNNLSALSSNEDFLGLNKSPDNLVEAQPTSVQKPNKDLATLNSNEEFLGLNKTPDNYVMQNSGVAKLSDALGITKPSLDLNEVSPDLSQDDSDNAQQAISNIKAVIPQLNTPSVSKKTLETPKVPAMKAPSSGDEEFDAAQQAADENRKNAMILSAVSKIGTALANQNNTMAPDIKNSMEDVNKELLAQASSPLEALKAKREQYKKLIENRMLAKSQDPSSPESIAARELYRSMGGKVDDTATASDLDNSLKYLQQKYSVDEAHRSRMMQYQMMAEAKKEALANKLNDKDKADLDKFTNVITGNSRGAEQFKNLNARMNGVGQALALIQAHKVNGKSFIRPAEMTELNMELARILTGSGVVHESTMRHIDPTSGPRAFAEMMEKATGQPYNIQNIDAQIDRLSHNLSNQYTQAEKQLTNMGSTIARGNEHKVSTLNNYLKDQRAINGVDSALSSSSHASTKGKVSNSTLQDYANKHKISVDSAKDLLTKSGYEVE